VSSKRAENVTRVVKMYHSAMMRMPDSIVETEIALKHFSFQPWDESGRTAHVRSAMYPGKIRPTMAAAHMMARKYRIRFGRLTADHRWQLRHRGVRAIFVPSLLRLGLRNLVTSMGIHESS
jgi:hypothetical protein